MKKITITKQQSRGQPMDAATYTTMLDGLFDVEHTGGTSRRISISPAVSVGYSEDTGASRKFSDQRRVSSRNRAVLLIRSN